MQNELKGRGALFPQLNKSSERAPDYNGPLRIPLELIEAMLQMPTDEEGRVEMRMAGWRTVSQRGSEYISIALEVSREMPEEREAPRRTQAQRAAATRSTRWGPGEGRDGGGEIPF